MVYRKKYTRKPRVNYRKKQGGFSVPRTLRKISPVRTLRNIPTLQRLRFSTVITLDPAIGSKAFESFRANSPNNPQNMSTEHSAMRFSEMSSFYNWYTVLGSKCTVSRIGSASNNEASVPVAWGILISDSLSAPGEYNTYIERGTTNYRIANDTNSSRQQNLTKKFSTKRFFNVTDIKDNVDSLGSTVGDHPERQGWFVVWSQNMKQTTGNPIEVTYLVTIDYIVSFSKPKDLQGS